MNSVNPLRGELEVSLDRADQLWRYAPGEPLLPLEVDAAEIGEWLEGRLVTFTGMVSGWQGDSIYLSDAKQPDADSAHRM